MWNLLSLFITFILCYLFDFISQFFGPHYQIHDVFCICTYQSFLFLLFHLGFIYTNQSFISNVLEVDNRDFIKVFSFFELYFQRLLTRDLSWVFFGKENIHYTIFVVVSESLLAKIEFMSPSLLKINFIKIFDTCD